MKKMLRGPRRVQQVPGLPPKSGQLFASPNVCATLVLGWSSCFAVQIHCRPLIPQLLQPFSQPDGDWPVTWWTQQGGRPL